MGFDGYEIASLRQACLDSMGESERFDTYAALVRDHMIACDDGGTNEFEDARIS